MTPSGVTTLWGVEEDSETGVDKHMVGTTKVVSLAHSQRLLSAASQNDGTLPENTRSPRRNHTVCMCLWPDAGSSRRETETEGKGAVLRLTL